MKKKALLKKVVIFIFATCLFKASFGVTKVLAAELIDKVSQEDLNMSDTSYNAEDKSITSKSNVGSTKAEYVKETSGNTSKDEHANEDENVNKNEPDEEVFYEHGSFELRPEGSKEPKIIQDDDKNENNNSDSNANSNEKTEKKVYNYKENKKTSNNNEDVKEVDNNKKRLTSKKYNIKDDKKTYTYICTDKISDQEVNEFAKKIRDLILAKQWERLADEINYPIEIDGKKVHNKEEFLKIDFEALLTSKFYERIQNQDYNALFANWRGIMIGDGDVWINETEIGGKPVLKIFAFTNSENKNETTSNDDKGITKNENTSDENVNTSNDANTNDKKTNSSKTNNKKAEDKTVDKDNKNTKAKKAKKAIDTEKKVSTTGDDMSIIVIVASIIGSVLVVAMIGYFIFRKKKI